MNLPTRQEAAIQALADEHGRVSTSRQSDATGAIKVDVWGNLNGALSGWTHLGVWTVATDGIATEDPR